MFGRYRERRSPYRSLSVEERFRLLTSETSETLYVGKMVLATVTGFASRKPHRDQIDQANPERNEESGQWQCPFCLQDSFPELSEVIILFLCYLFIYYLFIYLFIYYYIFFDVCSLFIHRIVSIYRILRFMLSEILAYS